MHALAAILLALLPAVPATAQTCTATIPDPAPLNACADGARVTIAFAGDVLLHSPLQRRGYADGFAAVWGAADPILARADIAIANLEGPVAAGMTRGFRLAADPGPVFDNSVHTSYPLFNYHASVLAALAASGVDVVTTANNHALDRGSAGADATIAALRAAGLPFTGTEIADGPRDFALDWPTPLGRLVLIACSYSTNGVPDPHGQVAGCYDDTFLPRVARHAARADVLGVIVLPHWGWEYTSQANAAQTALAADLARAGATLVVGTHPHVVQGWDMLGTGAGTVPVVYSTGNFVSGQPQFERQTGMIAWAALCRAAPGPDLAASLAPRLAVAGLGWVPIRMTRTGAGPALATVGPDGAAGAVAEARDHIDRIVPGHGLDARVTCTGDRPEIAAASPPVLLQ